MQRPPLPVLLVAGFVAVGCGTEVGSRTTDDLPPAEPPSVAAVSSDLATAAATITADDFDRRIRVIAHDSMRGRWTPSPELEATAAWIADELRAMGVSGGMDGQYIQRYSVQLQTADGVRVIEAPNVVGLIEGSDPRLRDEHLVFSAHMDHVGVGRPDASGDSIYNGADDDGSGTVAILEVAEAMATLDPPPRRSVLFLWVSGEERGLWGSAYFTAQPPVPVDRMVANINLDMVGRNWTDTIVAIGKEHSDLGPTLHRVADRHPELDMEPIDDLWPAESFYTRSDHYNFARRGVPALFFFNGTHVDYHLPSDEPDKVDSDKATRIARLVFYLGVEVANAARPPRWDPDSYRQIVEAGR